MRFLLALMAMTLFAISVGCDKAADKPADKPADVAPATTDITLPDTEGTQTVSIKLPGMT